MVGIADNDDQPFGASDCDVEAARVLNDTGVASYSWTLCHDCGQNDDVSFLSLVIIDSTDVDTTKTEL